MCHTLPHRTLTPVAAVRDGELATKAAPSYLPLSPPARIIVIMALRQPAMERVNVLDLPYHGLVERAPHRYQGAAHHDEHEPPPPHPSVLGVLSTAGCAGNGQAWP